MGEKSGKRGDGRQSRTIGLHWKRFTKYKSIIKFTHLPPCVKTQFPAKVISLIYSGLSKTGTSMVKMVPMLGSENLDKPLAMVRPLPT